MKEIYFSQNQQNLIKRLSKNLIYYSSDSIGKAFPTWTLGLAEKVLCSPTRSRTPWRDPSFEMEELDVLGQKLRVYSKGESKKTVLFAHGWSGHAGNFSGFFDEYLKRGYRVVAFDHLAHGSSSGEFANLFLFIQGTRRVLEHISFHSDIAGIVAHSMGGSAVISTLQSQDAQIPLGLIAPVVPLFESLKDSLDNFGISQRWLETLLTHLEHRYTMKIEDIDPKNRIHDLNNPTLILHDQNDSYIPLEMNRRFLPENFQRQVVVTENLGHFRILKHRDVIMKTAEFIDHA